MRRTVVAFIISVFLLGGGLYLLKSEHSDTQSAMKEQQTATVPRDQNLQSQKNEPLFPFQNLSQEITADHTSPGDGADKPSENKGAVASSVKSETAKGKQTVSKPVTVMPAKPASAGKPEQTVATVKSNEGTEEKNTVETGISPLFYKGIQLDVIGLDINIGSEFLK